ncbi:MAG: sigma-70 family RNA polymerase sigma factor [Pirellulales bacterium]|nr:sigma-70 family RNA polymerase sigma factor [Planctomycetales bacterium]
MAPTPDADQLLVARIRNGDEDAWDELIGRFEGRLLAFVDSRLGQRASAEDVVQESFVGFLTSLPNYDCSRSLESYLFSIAAHKLTDHLRREGRRPTVPLQPETNSEMPARELPGSARRASSIVRSGERRGLEESALVEAISHHVERWRERGDWEKIRVTELLFVRGWANKHVASHLGLSEQTVANYKFDFLAKLRSSVKKQGLPPDVFPELHDAD